MNTEKHRAIPNTETTHHL